MVDPEGGGAVLRRELRARLERAGAARPDFEADQIALHVLGCSRNELLRGVAVTPEQRDRCLRMADRRAAGEPLQYLLGAWEFYGLPFRVGPGVLIPRADTETLVDASLRALAGVRAPCVLDLCAGSGCIAAAIACNRADARVTAVEWMPAAMGYLRENLARLCPQAETLEADVLAPPPKALPPGAFDLIVSNPPYVERDKIAGLMREVQAEPRSALDGGPDGLDFYRAIVRHWLSPLRAGGTLAVEVGAGQAEAVRALFAAAGLEAVRTARDLAGIERVILGTASPLK